jgi:hypothetical protein
MLTNTAANLLNQATRLNANANVQAAVPAPSNGLQAPAPRTTASTSTSTSTSSTAVGRNLVSVTVKQVVAIDSRFDLFSKADFYAKVEINGNKQQSKTIDNEDNIQPNWYFGQKVATTQRYVPLSISVFDEDSPDGDDQADLNPLKDHRALDLTYDIVEGKVIGGAGLNGRVYQKGSDIIVRGAGDSDRAEVRFSVNHQYVAPQRTVRLTVDQASAIDSFDIGSQADFYAQVTMNGITHESKTISNQNYIQPNWQFDRVAGSSRYIPIELKLFDNDGRYSGDDQADINPLSNNRSLNLSYDIETGKISGQGLSRAYNKNEQIVIRGAGDKNRAEIRFRITDLMV